MEIWKDIGFIKGIDYTGLYQANNKGDIKRKGKLLILKQYISKKGYLTTGLCKNGKVKMFQVHRLIMVAFNKNSILEVNHKDGNKQNNRLENLEYCTRSENIKHKFNILGYKNHFHKKNPMKGKLGSNSLLSKKIIQYDNSGKFIKKWGSMTQAGKETGTNRNLISEVCRGNRKTTGGFIWKYNVI